MPQLWIKLWPQQIFDGELILHCDLKEIGLLYGLYLLAKVCPVVEVFPPNDRMPYEHAEKLISLTEYRPYPRNLLAQKFRVDVDWLDQALAKFKELKEIREDSRGIWIVSWEEHQGEYDRQSLYRQGKIRKRSNAPSCPYCSSADNVLPDRQLAKERGHKSLLWRCTVCGAVYNPETKTWEVKHEKKAGGTRSTGGAAGGHKGAAGPG